MFSSEVFIKSCALFDFIDVCECLAKAIQTLRRHSFQPRSSTTEGATTRRLWRGAIVFFVLFLRNIHSLEETSRRSVLSGVLLFCCSPEAHRFGAFLSTTFFPWAFFPVEIVDSPCIPLRHQLSQEDGPRRERMPYLLSQVTSPWRGVRALR